MDLFYGTCLLRVNALRELSAERFLCSTLKKSHRLEDE